MSIFEKAERLKSLPPYLFKEIDRKKEELMAKGVDIINLGIGDPDLPTPGHIIEAVKVFGFFACLAWLRWLPAFAGMTRYWMPDARCWSKIPSLAGIKKRNPFKSSIQKASRRSRSF